MMRSQGIVCEYSRFTLGHARSWSSPADGSRGGGVSHERIFYVQQGQPAVFDRMVPDQSRPLAGADLVLSFR